ncbi:BamA/TamA family outer membrane protein [Nafulsella turpanensis]|uniref:BamA/TamA family outer membrane protein n=1 Tax=Nafulsella turpanensis TaxID=1265690 RepID=UPI00034B141C|nr:BamA/TamA family outer membrane protein [Nafulsella turpanensis]
MEAQVVVVPFGESYAEDTLVKHLVKIDKIHIKGNKKTKDFIITRELSLSEGEFVAIEDLYDVMMRDRRKIINTRLFTKVEMTAIPSSERLYDVLVEVQERWYIVAAPIFQLADRNFNDWWVNQERDLSRVNIGGKFVHYNFRGRSEKLSLIAQFGYSRDIRLGYYVPYIDQTRKNGMGVSFAYSENSNVPIETEGHKRLFFGQDEPIREIYAAGVNFVRRASFYNTHTAFLSFYSNNLADTVLELNPDYLLTGKNTMRYFVLSYLFRRDLRDIRSYPLRGFMIQAELSKRGIGLFNDINSFSMEASYHHHFPLGHKFFFSNSITGRLTAPEKLPYSLLSGLGYGGNYIRGFELYVIEGQHFAINKSELRFQLVKEEINLGKLMPLEQFRYFPIAVYPKMYFDVGSIHMPFSYPKNEAFSNKLIWGAGLGLDIVSFYDFVFRTEYTFTSEGERGFFLNFASGI